MAFKKGQVFAALIVIFIVIGAAAFIYGTAKNPDYAEFWNAIGFGFSQENEDAQRDAAQDEQAVMEETVSEKKSTGRCYGLTDCSSDEICVSTRVCLVVMDGKCGCFGTTVGSCNKYVATGVQVKNCALTGARCANEPGTDIIYSLCCPGMSCNNGKCEGPSGRCPFTLNE